MELTDDQLIEIFDLVFTSIHSSGFRKSEAHSLLFDSEYWFLERPKQNWQSNIITYLDAIGFDKSKLNINPHFLNVK